MELKKQKKIKMNWTPQRT